jgi:integrase
VHHKKNICEKLKFKLHSGHYCYALIHPEIGRISEYQDYLMLLIERELSTNTVENQAQDLKRFFEYYFSFSDLNKFCELKISSTLLHSIITSFPSYLIQGQSSSSHFAGYAAKTNQAKPVSPKTAARILSTVNSFVQASSELNASLVSLEQTGLVDIDVDQDELFKSLGMRTELDSRVARNVNAKSLLASVVRGGARYTTSKAFKTPRSAQYGAVDKVSKAFPLQYIFPLIEAANSSFDRCLWSLLAGTGIRLSEALQILLRDIVVEDESVFVIDPFSRLSLYSDLPESYIQKISFKGRSTESTYFLEPFKTFFFDSLGLYLLERERTGATHEVLFVSRSSGNDRLGMPLFNSKEISKRFSRTANKLGIKGSYTPHSLRHFYGVYCLNFMPLGNGEYGLNVSVVKDLMGHQSEESTKGYAVIDKLVLSTTIEYANKLISSGKLGHNDMADEAIQKKLASERKRLGFI